MVCPVLINNDDCNDDDDDDDDDFDVFHIICPGSVLLFHVGEPDFHVRTCQ